MAADDTQAQIEALQAQLQLAQLKAQLAELERQKSTEPAAAAPPAPAELAVPAPLPEVVPPAPLPAAVPAPLPAAVPSARPPVDDVPTCATWSGETVPCRTEADLVDFGELFGVKSAAPPSWEQLQQLDTLLPIIGVLGALSIGFIVLPKATESLRPDDAAATRRKREERERLGVSELDEEREEQEKQIARDNTIQSLVAVVLIVLFELAIFNLRNV